ncbi:MAG: group 1 truncated hemoglobin [Bacteriovoracaceae bacterium]|nr:group 1 truncated hemoglobin [Bacteriovoracaceae bacterium]
MSIYQKYGGYNFFHDCIYGLYLDMGAHPEIAYHFIGVDLVSLSKLQTQFLIRAIGGPDEYHGRDLKEVHLNMKITPFEFQEIARAFKGVFEKNGVESKDVEVIMNFVKGFQSEIITAQTSWIDRIMKPIYKFFNLRKY